ncbi:hypothetical protein GIB67_017529 [Kingdonia uniflora]|uniref:Uncharacterized protein n=1 Tax=Kingdonia uniflora TaxID=39325 RepID=A0A7J7M4L4_9MAGN|nr:hypothetical protein GIB67_017529 [Kingdonia uniflora]
MSDIIVKMSSCKMDLEDNIVNINMVIEWRCFEDDPAWHSAEVEDDEDEDEDVVHEFGQLSTDLVPSKDPVYIGDSYGQFLESLSIGGILTKLTDMDCLEWELLDQDVFGKFRLTLTTSISSKLPNVSTMLEMIDKLSKMFESTSSNLNSQKCVRSVLKSHKWVTFSDVIKVFGDDSRVIPFGSSLLTSGDYSNVEVKGNRVSHIENRSKRRIKA